ncbi:hypothetical protein [Nostoc sp.]|uniref:hypothetical protein n=1 Tax=Nostoc sp. TaxID=1180 RepID=UPI002FF832B1
MFAVADVYKNLITNRTQILPTSEMEEADCKVLTAKIAKDIADRTSVTNTYQIGEVCQILVKDNPELRGKGGCWAIVSAVNDFSCSVRIWDGEHTVGLQHLKSYNYLPAEGQQVREISDRKSSVPLYNWLEMNKTQ